MVVFDPYSGDTHCMEKVAGDVLAYLSQCGTATTEELRAALGKQRRLSQEDESGDFPLGVLEELEKLRLVQSAAR